MTRRPLPVRPALGPPRCLIRLRGRRLGVLLGVLVALATAPIAALASPGEIAARKAEVQDVLAQIDELDISLGSAIEAYNAATVRLDEITTWAGSDEYRHLVAWEYDAVLAARRAAAPPDGSSDGLFGRARDVARGVGGRLSGLFGRDRPPAPVEPTDG